MNHHQSLLAIFFSFFLFLSHSLYSMEKVTAFELYEPGVFNPLGPTLLYGDGDIKQRPYMLLAINDKGHVIERSLLQYDTLGKLVAEKIFSSNNTYKGEIRYVYNSKNQIIEEQYYDHEENLISKKVRIYQKDQLVQINFYEREEIVYSRVYNYQKNVIIGKELQKTYSDPFVIRLKDGLITSIEYKDKNSILMKIDYKYTNNILVERFKVARDLKSKCVYSYDDRNRLIEYTYYDLIRNQWKKNKTIKFVYADQI